MDLEVKDVAELLSVSETTVRHWIAEGKIPAYRLNRQYRFNRIEIEDWVMRHHLEQYRLKEPEGHVEHPPKGSQQFSLYRAIHHGGIFYNVSGATKDEIIKNMAAELATRLQGDAGVIGDLLLDREEMMPTSLGQGIGIPHTRDYILSGSSDIVAVVFPKEPLDWGALDGEKAHTLFFLFAASDKNHLHLLAKIAYLSSQPSLVNKLSQKPDKEALLELVKDLEVQLALRTRGLGSPQ